MFVPTLSWCASKESRQLDGCHTLPHKLFLDQSITHLYK